MKKRVSTLTGLVLVLVLALAGTATAATTLGTTTQPIGSTRSDCGESSVINQLTSAPSTPYQVPGTGTITQWQINTNLDLPGAPVELVVLRPVGIGNYTVVGVDVRHIPTPLPAGNVATYALASPIAVQANDTFGLYTNDASSTVVCYWHGGFTPPGASLAQLDTMLAPVPGQSLAIGELSGGTYTMNLAATFEPPAAAAPTPTPTPTPTKKKCKKHKKKHSAASAKKKCKKKKK
jgi:hypothetical protein